MLAGCATPPAAMSPSAVSELTQRAMALLPADVLLLGEQHDAAAHRQLQRALVQALAGRDRLAALALEMSERGTSTAALPRQATEAQVQEALKWRAANWPWAVYAPVVMAAVQAGVPVLGANLPRASIPEAMKTIAYDDHFKKALWQKQQENIRESHCKLLPASQIVPMTRVQIARDATMAQAATAARQPGKTVLLIAGNSHVDRELGVPTHFAPGLTYKSVVLSPQRPVAVAAQATPADAVLTTPALAPKDHCADLRRQMKKPAA